jgi:ATP-dependent DNA helicase RecG
LLDSIRERPGLRIPELSGLIQIPPKTIERWLKQLRDQEKIVFKGAPKKGGYHVKEKDE